MDGRCKGSHGGEGARERESEGGRRGRRVYSGRQTGIACDSSDGRVGRGDYGRWTGEGSLGVVEGDCSQCRKMPSVVSQPSRLDLTATSGLPLTRANQARRPSRRARGHLIDHGGRDGCVR